MTHPLAGERELDQKFVLKLNNSKNTAVSIKIVWKQFRSLGSWPTCNQLEDVMKVNIPVLPNFQNKYLVSAKFSKEDTNFAWK